MVEAKIYPNLQSIALAKAIYVDDNGFLGTEYPLGTSEFPVLTFAQALTIAGIRNSQTFVIHGSHALAAAMEHYNFLGHTHMDPADIINLNGQDVDASGFYKLVITGAQGGTGYVCYYDCLLVSVTGLRGFVRDCCLHTAIGFATAGANDNIDLINCHSSQGGVTITVNTPDLVNFYRWSGEMTLQTMGGGTINIWVNDGARINILATCTAGTINIYGNATVDNRAAGTAVHIFTLNTHVQQLVEGHKGLYESWQDEFIDDNIWAVTDPATGAPWARGVSGAFLLNQCAPVLNETARLRGLHHWVHNWLADPKNLLLKRLCMEWEMTLGVHTNVDNTVSFWGWMPIAAGLRTTDDIIGFALLGDALQAVTDSGGAETVTAVGGETMSNHNKFKIVIQESEVLFYFNEQLVAVHTTNVPTDPVLPNFYLDTEATGGCAFVFGVIRIWQETIERY